MSSSETRVFAIGLTQAELRLFMGICTVSQRRACKLTAVPANKMRLADVLLVDKNSEEYAKYQHDIEMLSKNNLSELSKLIVVIDGDNPKDTNIARPIEWSRLPEFLATQLADHKRIRIAELAGNSSNPQKLPSSQHSPSQHTPSQHPSKQHSSKPETVINNSNNPHAPHILVVDDSLVVREQLSSILAEHGYAVTTASSGEEALQKFKPNYYSKVLLDVIMPKADGYEICRKLRSIDKGTPVIMLTSKSSPFDKIRGKMAGCKAYLTKPVVLDNLLKRLRA